ncbi:DUF4396 domain-containing protein [Amycolatopsis carbonis]|uniref:DUF4396 domain-containing protein n=1 Tax=Amycolatopsis carbonis TaxID=715471 RepID=A0A9Y2IHS8_9PSEU|nr:DUF4396 domain-containing protein [Amycolatopsis sp. 2-15]WIX79236.1 DUF4396 domain-containing protein [Amycolatopsis sp. 2-15]
MRSLPGWLTPLAWVFLTLAVASVAAIAYDIYGRGRRHARTTSELVWVGSALYLGPFALAAYARYGRAGSSAVRAGDRALPDGVATLPGGSTSAVAHVIAVPLVIASGLTIAGNAMWVMILVIVALSVALLYAYERSTGTARATPIPVATAIGVAVLTVVVFDIGMVGWMLVLYFTGFMPPASDASFWLLMQFGTVLGLLTSYPVVTRLTRRNRTAALA